MKFKNQIRRLFNKKASASVGVAIKVLTSVVLGAAMLAGTYGVVKTNVVPTAENKVSSMFEVTDTVELNGGGSGGVVVPDPVVEIKRNGVIPEGGTYYTGGKLCGYCSSCYGVRGVPHGPMTDSYYEFTNTPTATYSAGDNFPASPSVGDIYVEGDYIYDYFSSGWRVRAAEDKSVYGAIVSEIAGKPLTSMYYTFYSCSRLTTAPVIPSSVTDMSYTFGYCMSLTTAPAIPSSVTDMDYTFQNCRSLTTAPTIPSSVTSMIGTFVDCVSLTGTIIINANPSGYNYCFGCYVEDHTGIIEPKSITITGSSTMLNELANTADNGNVTVG